MKSSSWEVELECQRFKKHSKQPSEGEFFPLFVFKSYNLNSFYYLLNRCCFIFIHVVVSHRREELGKGINTDEAAALGAVYQAAHLGKGFKVQKFNVKEAIVYPIQVWGKPL